MATHGETQFNLPSKEATQHHPPKKDQSLKKVILETLKGTDKIVEDLQQQEAKGSESEMVECECCGMSEECTPTYISRIKEFYGGKWVCGLCSEAVKEQMKNPTVSVQESLESHMALCMKFNKTVRINPKLSFASTMREIARRSSQRRTSNEFLPPRIARTTSCGARIALKVEQSPIQ